MEDSHSLSKLRKTLLRHSVSTNEHHRRVRRRREDLRNRTGEDRVVPQRGWEWDFHLQRAPKDGRKKGVSSYRFTDASSFKKFTGNSPPIFHPSPTLSFITFRPFSILPTAPFAPTPTATPNTSFSGHPAHRQNSLSNMGINSGA